MDILAHTLWTNALARQANKIARRKKRESEFKLHVGWTAFWGVFPDFFAFTIPFCAVVAKVVAGRAEVGSLGAHHADVFGFDLAHFLYQYSHSLIIFAIVFVLAWVVSRRPRFEMLGWALHILIDIPSHTLGFYPTPFLFPISNYHFPDGVSWANSWYMIINYTALLLVWGKIWWGKFKKQKI